MSMHTPSKAKDTPKIQRIVMIQARLEARIEELEKIYLDLDTEVEKMRQRAQRIKKLNARKKVRHRKRGMRRKVI